MDQNDKKRRKPSTSPDATINSIPTDVISFMLQFLLLVEVLSCVGTCKLFQICYKTALRKVEHLTFPESHGSKFVSAVKRYCNANTVESLHLSTYSQCLIMATPISSSIACSYKIQTLNLSNVGMRVSVYLRVIPINPWFPYLRNLSLEFVTSSDMMHFIAAGLHLPKLERLSMVASVEAFPGNISELDQFLIEYMRLRGAHGNFFHGLPNLRSLYLGYFAGFVRLYQWVCDVGRCAPVLEELTLPWKIDPKMFLALNCPNLGYLFPSIKKLKVNLAVLNEVQQILRRIRPEIEVAQV